MVTSIILKFLNSTSEFFVGFSLTLDNNTRDLVPFSTALKDIVLVPGFLFIKPLSSPSIVTLEAYLLSSEMLKESSLVLLKALPIR